jgi:hypothetical protein
MWEVDQMSNRAKHADATDASTPAERQFSSLRSNVYPLRMGTSAG